MRRSRYGRRAREETDMDRHSWTRNVGRTARGTCGAGSIRLDETGDNANWCTTVVAKVAADPSDDATAAVRVFAPAGTQLTTDQAPGTRLGTATAVAKALALAGADVPLRAYRRRSPGAGLHNDTGGMPPRRHAAGNIGHGARSGPPASANSHVPRHDDGHDCSARPCIRPVCLPPPDIPESLSSAPFGLKLYSATLSRHEHLQPCPPRRVDRHLDAVHAGTVGRHRRTIATPATIAPGAVNLAAKRTGLGADSPAS